MLLFKREIYLCVCDVSVRSYIASPSLWLLFVPPQKTLQACCRSSRLVPGGLSPLFVPLMSLSNNFAVKTEVLEVGIRRNPCAKSFLHASFEAVAWFWECCVVSCEQALGGKGGSKGTSPGHRGVLG